MQGIDVSADQGVIDWGKVKADAVDFAVIKATQGRGEGVLTRMLKHFTVSTFVRNILGASAAGLDVSVYHYFTATDVATAADEARYFVSVIEPYHAKITAYAAVDVESKYLDEMLPAKLAECVDAFCQVLYENAYQPLVYTNPLFLRYRFPAAFAQTHDIWLAHWGASEPYQVPYLRMWQYGAGYVDGVKKLVDLDVGYYDTREVVKVWQVGDVYTIKTGDTYTNGRGVPARLIGRSYPVAQVGEGAILLGGIMSWVKVR